MKKILTMTLLLAAAMGFYSCSSDDDDSPLLELTIENITGYWYCENEEEYISYEFLDGYGYYYYESEDGPSKSEYFSYRIETGGSALYITTSSGTSKYQVSELRNDRVTIEGENGKWCFIKENYYDEDDDEDYDGNNPSEIPQPVPPTGEGTKIIGTWGNPTFISSSDPEDWEDNSLEGKESTFTFYADGSAYFYDSIDPEDSFNFIYEYKHNENLLILYCGPNGQIRSGRTIRFESDNKIIMRDDYYYDPEEGMEYSDLTYSLTRIN